MDGATPDVEQVLSVVMANDYSPAGIDAHEFAAARERRRQRAQREAEAYGNAAGGFHAGGGAPVPAGMQPPVAKRKPEYGSDSGEEEGFGHAAGGAAGADVYRMRRKMARP